MENKQVNIQIQPEKINAVYSDVFALTRSAQSFTLDIGQHVPQLNMINIFSRVTFTPQHAKQLAGLLGDAITAHEKEHGEIKTMPPEEENFVKQGLGFRP